ncbi:DUF2793 domain-containing protein [uncultured Erythrobacter sp.]|uniref:DUF2793 domain-containing protein n=1 Tax=uncultured Erythrobacter sp. TaxID=263913 RepID=UPI0026192722|nr:DUF2793 domain-containing protein [uncultured Erythrobacter sp.]
MPEPITFSTATNQFQLPLLFAGQAQKEFFVNQSLVLVDSLLQQGVVATLDAPPASPEDGDTYLVGESPSGEWENNEARIAIRIGGAWQFIEPFEGMHLFDRNAGSFVVYRSGWTAFVAPDLPQGGGVVDAEARNAIAELTQTLLNLGWLRSNG